MLTDVGGVQVEVDVQVEFPGSHGVHLDEGDAAAGPLRLRLIEGEEGLQEQVGDALADALGVDGQAGQQVLDRAHVPKLAGGRTHSCLGSVPAMVCSWIYVN